MYQEQRSRQTARAKAPGERGLWQSLEKSPVSITSLFFGGSVLSVNACGRVWRSLWYKRLASLLKGRALTVNDVRSMRREGSRGRTREVKDAPAALRLLVSSLVRFLRPRRCIERNKRIVMAHKGRLRCLYILLRLIRNGWQAQGVPVGRSAAKSSSKRQHGQSSFRSAWH